MLTSESKLYAPYIISDPDIFNHSSLHKYQHYSFATVFVTAFDELYHMLLTDRAVINQTEVKMLRK